MEEEFNNSKLFGSVYEYIIFLVNKRKALQHERQIVNAHTIDKHELAKLSPELYVRDRYIIRNAKRARVIEGLITEIEDELKSYDHRYDGEPGTHQRRRYDSL